MKTRNKISFGAVASLILTLGLVFSFQNCSNQSPSDGAYNYSSTAGPQPGGTPQSGAQIQAADTQINEGSSASLNVHLIYQTPKDYVILWDIVKEDLSPADAAFASVSGYFTVASGISDGSLDLQSLDDGRYDIPDGKYILRLKEGGGILNSTSIKITVKQKTFSGSISTANNTSCGTIEGVLKCWGANGNGQFGNGTTSGSNAPVTIATLPMNSFVQKISVGSSNFSCALLSTGAVYCSGVGSSGQMGDGSTANRTTFAAVPMLATGVSDITTGGSHACAIKAGSLYCWGLNSSGQLGLGDTTNRTAPTLVASLGADVASVSAGTAFTCVALKSTGAVKCFGLGTSGQLGNATLASNSSPVDVSGAATGATMVAAGSTHACALFGDYLKCWGSNGNGQLGDATNVAKSIATPVAVIGAGGSQVSYVTAGLNFSCALVAGVPYCWGLNGNGQIGGTVGAAKNIPTMVGAVLGSGFSGISAALDGQQSCAIKPPNAIHCWGEASSGQTGIGSAPTNSAPRAAPIAF